MSWSKAGFTDKFEHRGKNSFISSITFTQLLTRRMNTQHRISVTSVTFLIFCLACHPNMPPTDAEGRPLIVKRGTIDVDLVETTPIVLQNRVYRFEYVRIGYWDNDTGDSYFRFIDHKSGEAT